MFRGLLYFVKFSWNLKKSYLVFSISMEIIKVIISLSNIIMPMYVLNEIFITKRMSWIIFYIGLFLGIDFLGSQLVNRLRISIHLAKEIVKREFELSLLKNQMECDFWQIENPEFQDLRVRANEYVNGQWNQFGKVMEEMFSVFSDVITLTGIVYIIASIHIAIIIVFFLLVTLNGWVNSYYKNKRQKLISGFAPVIRRRGYFEDITKNPLYAKEIQLGNLKSWLLDKYRHYMDIFRKETAKIHKNDVIQKHILEFTTFIQQGITYIYLVMETLAANMTIGQFTMYMNAANTFNGTLNRIMDKLLEISKYTIYYKDFKKYTEFSFQTRKGKEKIEDVEGQKFEIEFRNVSFRYSQQKDFVLKNINIKIYSGRKISVVGENGAGKTTFIKLLMRLYDPTEGNILLNGKDIREFDYNSYMKIFSVVFQDYKLFAFSIKENIALLKSKDIENQTIMEIMKKINLYDKINSLKKGIDTSIFKYFDSEGIELSGGEAQRIVIARAILKNSPVMILDEPTASLDPRTEDEIYEQFHQLTKDKTVIYISHRLASSKICDEILVFEKGEIVERGSHQKLMEQNKLYRELFEMQAQYYTSVI